MKVTDKQILALKRHARLQGDDKLVDICSNALGAKPFRDPQLNRRETKAARLCCAEILNARNAVRS